MNIKKRNASTINSLLHTIWKSQYHLVFTPKYHRKIIYGALRAEIGKILRELCKRKDVDIIEAHAMPEHSSLPSLLSSSVHTSLSLLK